MFWKSKTPTAPTPAKKTASPSVISADMHILGTVVSEGIVDVSGTLDGNMRGQSITIRAGGCVNGDVVAESVFVFGRVKGMIRARHVHLHASCHVEGIIMHESLTIEDGAFVDGKFKRSDKLHEPEVEDITFKMLDIDEAEESADDSGDQKEMNTILKNIRLIG